MNGIVYSKLYESQNSAAAYNTHCLPNHYQSDDNDYGYFFFSNSTMWVNWCFCHSGRTNVALREGTKQKVNFRDPEQPNFESCFRSLNSRANGSLDKRMLVWPCPCSVVFYFHIFFFFFKFRIQQTNLNLSTTKTVINVRSLELWPFNLFLNH